MTETQKAYLAGLIDADGCMLICKRRTYGAYKTPRYTLAVSLQMSHEDTIAWAAAFFGQKVMKKNPNGKSNMKKPGYRVTWSSCKARQLLADLLPYFITKRDQAVVAIEFHDRCRRRGSKGAGRRLSEEELSFREACYQRLRHLKTL